MAALCGMEDAGEPCDAWAEYRTSNNNSSMSWLACGDAEHVLQAIHMAARDDEPIEVVIL